MNLLVSVFILSLLVQPSTQPAAADSPSDGSGRAIAQTIVEASGGNVWPKVTRIQFTFNVESEGVLKMSAKHDWNVRTGVDTVTVGGKTTATNVYEPTDRNEDELVAFKRWTNDSYWLLMPLKLLDGGVKFGPVMMTRDMPPSRGRMTMSFDGVGLTPGDKYDLSINLKENRIDHWTYRPNDETSSGFTWENYQDFNGLILATERKSDDGKRRIYFTDVQVERD